MHPYVQIFNGGVVFFKSGMTHPSWHHQLLPFTYSLTPLARLAVVLSTLMRVVSVTVATALVTDRYSR